MSRPAGPRSGTPPTTSSSTGLRTRVSGPPAGPAAGCLIPLPGVGRRTAGWRGRSPFPCPGWARGSPPLPRRPGHHRTLFSAAAACSGGRLEVLDGIFSTGRADCLAGWGGGMPRYFRHGGAVASRGFRWSRGLVSGPPEGLVSPAAGASPPMLPRGSGVPLRASRKAGPEGCFFALFARRFPVLRGAPEAPGGAKNYRTAKNGPVQEKCEGVSSYGL